MAHGQMQLYTFRRPPLPPPTIYIDFANNVGYNLVTGVSGPAGNFVTVSRVMPSGSTATDLMPWSPSGYAYQTFTDNTPRITPGFGLLSEAPPRGNYYPNSATPAPTRATASLATTALWLMWVNGPGSAALSNGTGTGCVGTATQGNPVTWTMSVTGTCTVTVTGTLYAIQVENTPATLLPAIGTSFIMTGAAAATRPTELTNITNSASLNVNYTLGSKGWFGAATTMNAHQTTIAYTDGTATNHTWLARFSGDGRLFFQNTGTGGISSQLPAPTPIGIIPAQSFSKFAAAVGINYQASSQDNFGTAASYAAYTPQNTILNTLQIGSNNPAGNSQSLFGYLPQVAVWPNNAMMQDQLRAWTRQ